MSKFVLNVRHRPTMAEHIEQKITDFVSLLTELPSPWGLAKGKELTLPPIGSALSTHAKLRGRLGVGISGDVKFQYRALGNLDDRAACDDALVIEFDSSKVNWRHFIDEGVPGYIRAMEAYTCRLERWDEMPRKFEPWIAACRALDKDLDGRDGFFCFGPVSYMDKELCRRGCMGMTPDQVVMKLKGTFPEVRRLYNGVLIVAAQYFPEQEEIVATDRVIRDLLDLPCW